MDMIPLSVAPREAGKKPHQLRKGGSVPCIVYGSDVKNLEIQCREADLHKAFQKAGESTLVELEIGERKIPVLFKHITFHPISGREEHADFYAVDMKKEIETAVPVHFEGESPAIKDQAGIFVITHESITVRCLPKDLPHALIANIATLANFHDVLMVKDIALPAGVTIMDEADMVIATVQEPRKEEEIVPVAAAVPAEGEAAAAPGAEGAPATEGAAAAPGADAGGAAPKEKSGGKEKK